MYYHASQTAGITQLEPRVSNHGKALVYLSEKRENVLVYLSNAVEKYCKETGFPHTSPSWSKWGPYGFAADGRQQIDEYYPNALEETYRGVSGYLYQAEAILVPGDDISIAGAVTSAAPVPVIGCEFIPDALTAILEAEQQGLLVIRRYEDHTPAWHEWSKRITREEHEDPSATPEYRHFLEHLPR